MSFELVCIWFPSGEGLGVCDKRLCSLPLMKGGRGMLTPKGAASLCVVSKHADADANGTSPYPLHKGDSLLLVIQRSVATKNLENTAQPYPLHKGDL